MIGAQYLARLRFELHWHFGPVSRRCAPICCETDLKRDYRYNHAWPAEHASTAPRDSSPGGGLRAVGQPGPRLVSPGISDVDDVRGGQRQPAEGTMTAALVAAAITSRVVRAEARRWQCAVAAGNFIKLPVASLDRVIYDLTVVFTQKALSASTANGGVRADIDRR